ncbi:MAG TPA: ROK family protein [Thermoflexales bacterium]|nr:ROK family protein [Thermoflexales bacterium]
MALPRIRKSAHRYTLGIDLGGTKILAAVVDEAGKVVASAKKTTQAQQGPQVVMKRLIKAMDDAVERAGLAKEDIAAIGIGVPGIIDAPRGVIIRITNIPGMENVEISRMLREWRPVPVVLSNDVRVAATGELRMGAGRGLRSMVTIFVGTGIGGGLILDGKIYEGTRGSAGEVGHMITMAGGPYAPGGGIRGGIEAIASRTAIERDLRAGIAAGRKTILPELLAEKNGALTSSVLSAAVEADDALTVEVLRRAAYYLGLHAASLINVLDPQALIYGGGVVEGLGHWMIDMIATTAREHAINRTGIEKVRIVEAALGEHAGVVGAALMAADLLLAPAPPAVKAAPAAAPVPKRRKPARAPQSKVDGPPAPKTASRGAQPPKVAQKRSATIQKPVVAAPATRRGPGRPPKAAKAAPRSARKPAPGTPVRKPGRMPKAR